MLENQDIGIEEDLPPDRLLDYIASIGNGIQKNALQAKAMLVLAKERGIPVDTSKYPNWQAFQPDSSIEIQLVRIRNMVSQLTTDIFNRGVRVTADELKAKMGEMNRPPVGLAPSAQPPSTAIPNVTLF